MPESHLERNVERDVEPDLEPDLRPSGDTAASTAEPRRHVHEFQVRFGDIDSLGHVNNCRYLTYLEDARAAMFYTDPVRNGRSPVRGLVVARHEIDYVCPLEFGPDHVRVETWVTEIRPASFRLAYEVRDDARVYATATSLLVAYDVKAGRPRRLVPHEQEHLGAYLLPGPPRSRLPA